MSRLTLRLPETLHQQLIHLAESEGVSLNQYIVYALTRQVALAYTIHTTPVEEINQQQQAFQALLKELGEASPSEVKAVLDKREIVQSEEELNPEIVARFQQHIRNASKA
ncbi:toxin-antitoxin system HicB family antitoxin [Nostocales cyanobacterium LEGE 11386]|nr:toxin-antitoxin system HicB family antitoxin [Nostocales cyanobacterium LEGE 11386]